MTTRPDPSQKPDPAQKTTEPHEGGGRKRSRAAAWTTGIVVVALAAGGIAWGVSSAQKPAPSPTLVVVGTPLPSVKPVPGPTATQAPAKAGETTQKPDPAYGAVVAKTVDVGTTAPFGGGVSVVVGAFTPMTIDAAGPGEVSGPGVKVSITVTNNGSAKVDLAGLAVNGFYGTDSSPASPVNSKTTAAKGTIEPGASASGAYVFAVPTDSQSTFRVTVGSGASPVIVVK